MFNENINKVLKDAIIETIVDSAEPIIKDKMKDIEIAMREGLLKEATVFVEHSFDCYKTGNTLNVKIHLPEIDNADTN